MLRPTDNLDLSRFSPNRAGLRGIELVKQTGKIMVQGGGTFGVFMSVSSTPKFDLKIRTLVTGHRTPSN